MKSWSHKVIEFWKPLKSIRSIGAGLPSHKPPQDATDHTRMPQATSPHAIGSKNNSNLCKSIRIHGNGRKPKKTKVHRSKSNEVSTSHVNSNKFDQRFSKFKEARANFVRIPEVFFMPVPGPQETTCTPSF